MGPVQREVLRDEVAFTDEVGLLDGDWPEVIVDGAQDALQTLAALGLPRVFRTVELVLFHAASCRFRYSSWTSCGVL